jgi:hypothetical protein
VIPNLSDRFGNSGDRVNQKKKEGREQKEENSSSEENGPNSRGSKVLRLRKPEQQKAAYQSQVPS